MNFVHDLFPDIKADIFLWSFLHELGHHFNREVVICADKLVGDNMEEHLTLPHEVIATDWASNWLQNKENRKTVKKFEKNFFSY